MQKESKLSSINILLKPGSILDLENKRAACEHMLYLYVFSYVLNQMRNLLSAFLVHWNDFELQYIYFVYHHDLKC